MNRKSGMKREVLVVGIPKSYGNAGKGAVTQNGDTFTQVGREVEEGNEKNSRYTRRPLQEGNFEICILSPMKKY